MVGHRDTAGEDTGPQAAEECRAGGWEQLVPGVLRRRLPTWDATVGAVRGPSGMLVVDTGSGLAEGARIRAELLGLTGLPVTQVVLTHPHFDHVLGAPAFAGARVYAARGMDGYLAGAREELRRDAVSEGMPPDAAAAAVGELVLPQQVVAEQLTLTLGERRVVLVNMGPAHSAHDLAVLVHGTRGGGNGREGGDGQDGPDGPESPGVVFCGDLVEESGEPQAGPDATPALWPAALDRLLSLGGEDALYVPGHGAVVGAEFVRAQRDVLARRFAQS